MSRKNSFVFATALSAFVIFVVWTLTTRKVYRWRNIDNLEMRTVTFDELPPIVADMFRNTKKYQTVGNTDPLISFDTVNMYKLDVEQTGPWIDYYVITKNDEVKFKVPYGKASPFVIHHDELFIPDRYNIANTAVAEIAKYEIYKLPE